MTDKNGVGVSVVSHDSESRTLVNDYGASGSYVRNVHYIGARITSVPQVAGLLDISAHCEQFIKYECYGSALLYMGSSDGWWVSRDLKKWHIGVGPLRLTRTNNNAHLDRSRKKKRQKNFLIHGELTETNKALLFFSELSDNLNFRRFLLNCWC